MILRAEAVVEPGGAALRWIHVKQWRALLTPHAGQRVLVSVERRHDRRSSQANRYYWGVVVPTIGGHLSLDRPLPLHASQVHHVLKSAFLGVEDTPLGPTPKSTRDLTTAEFAEYVDQIVAHAASEWGLAIPAPED